MIEAGFDRMGIDDDSNGGGCNDETMTAEDDEKSLRSTEFNTCFSTQRPHHHVLLFLGAFME